MANGHTLALHIRFVVNGAEVRPWRFRLFLWCARLLRVPAEFQFQSPPPVIVMQGSGTVQ